VNDLGLNSQVRLLGRLTRDEIKELIQTSHAIASTSWIETFGVNLIEALSCGKPVISTRSGGPDDFINRQNGILVPTGDEVALAESMKQMVEDWRTYDPDMIRSQCIERFSEKAIVRRLETMYEELLKQ
jgi:L-malate glycosyltransferase